MKNKMLSLFCIVVFLAVFSSAGNVAAAPLPSQPAQGSDTPGAPEAPTAGTDYLAIPAAAFLPEGEAENYENHGRYIKLLRSVAYESTDFIAAVHLPHGAKITQVSFCFHDLVEANATATLYYRGLDSATPVEVVSLSSWGNSGYQTISTTSIGNPIINNATSVYWVELNVPFPPEGGDTVWGCGATIRYNRPSSSTDILSIPSGTFKPSTWGYNYDAYNAKLVHRGYEDGSSGSGNYLSQVELPDGATVTKMTIHTWDSNPTESIWVWLRRVDTDGNPNQLAVASSPTSTGPVETPTTAISYATIDNTHYAYHIMLSLPEWKVNVVNSFYSVTIEYTLPNNQIYPTLSLSNPAFTGFFDDLDYYDSGYNFFHAHSEGGGSDPGVYLAPVFLPQGSKVSTVIFYYYDGTTTQSGQAFLTRTRWGVNEEMISFTTSGSAGYGYSVKAASLATIDNATYAYFAYYVLPVTEPPYLTDENVTPIFLAINYSPPQYVYLPLVRR